MSHSAPPPPPPPDCLQNTNSQKDDVDQDYFSSYADLEVHKLMLTDLPRTRAYERAITENRDFFQGKTVMDVGAGTGILSLFCFKAGAKRVYAVEASDMSAHLNKVVSDNGADQVIKVLSQRVEEVKLEEKVDVIVSEWMGFYLLHESMLDSVIYARDQHLRADGIMLPSHAKIWAAPTSYADQFWDNVFGFDMSHFKTLSRGVNEKKKKPDVVALSEEDLLSKPQQMFCFDLKWVTREEIESLAERRFVSCTNNAAAASSMTGLAIWFDCVFDPWIEEEGCSWSKPIILSTGPEAERTHWMQTVVQLPFTNKVELDEIIGWELKLAQSDCNPRHYNIMLSMLDPATEDHPVPCKCQMAKCTLMEALLEKEEEALIMQQQ